MVSPLKSMILFIHKKKLVHEKTAEFIFKEKEKWQASVASGDKRNFNFNTLSNEPLKFVIFQKIKRRVC